MQVRTITSSASSIFLLLTALVACGGVGDNQPSQTSQTEEFDASCTPYPPGVSNGNAPCRVQCPDAGPNVTCPGECSKYGVCTLNY
jgi:hypothetical protein